MLCQHILSSFIITPRAHARSGVKQSVLSVSRLSVSQSVSRLSVRPKILNFFHIDPHKPSKGSQTIANSKKLLYVYLTEVKALCLGCFSSYFLLFVTFGPTSSTSQYARCCIYYTVSGHSHTLDMAIHEHSIRDSTCSMRSSEMSRRL